MRGATIRTTRVIGRALAYGLTGAALVLLAGFVVYLDARPDLSVWHRAELDAELTADASVEDFTAYLALEDRLFAQLEERVLARVDAAATGPLDRYRRGSLADPTRWPRDWNRTFEHAVAAPRAGALLLHGMSDSPYSLRHVGRRLQMAGVHVVGLRIPGHGTAPVGLTDVRWEDMAAAVRLAARHLDERVGDAPLFVVGYSNGGALAVEYALASLRDPGLPRLEAIVLFSPEIGISPAAALAVWQERIGRLLGLEKLAWSSIGLEYDPFKYQSFAINAARQAHRLTGEIARRITEAAGSGDGLAGFPRVLVLQSAVDATVSTPAVIQGLLARLPARGNELVLFDLNRRTAIPELLRHDPAGMLTALLRDPTPFTLRVVTNESATSLQVVERLRLEGTDVTSRRRLGLSWPRDVFSLSHVALPFPPTDPLYGDERAEPSPGIRLGRVALRGERGVLRVPAADMLRARSNPFFPYVEERILAFLDLAASERRD